MNRTRKWITDWVNANLWDGEDRRGAKNDSWAGDPDETHYLFNSFAEDLFEAEAEAVTKIGEHLINAIACGRFVTISYPDPDVAHVFVWSSGAGEQLDALVASYLRDRLEVDDDDDSGN